MSDSRPIGRCLVTGATGFLGRKLVAALDEPVVLSRDPDRTRDSLGAGVEVHGWTRPEEDVPPAAALEGVETVFHLAGEPVAVRWTEPTKQRIRDSRVLGTRNLVEALSALDAPPAVLVSASAIGIYGDRGDTILDERSSHASDFLGQVCHGWETSALRARSAGIRTVCLRIGIVLGEGGGALTKMLTPFRLGIGGRLGPGNQWMSWIHIDDIVGLLLFSAGNSSLSGPVNATAPNPVTNRVFTRSLGRTLRRPTLFPVPELALKIAIGEFGSILLDSQRVAPTVALGAGYEFAHPTVEDALTSILRPGR